MILVATFVDKILSNVIFGLAKSVTMLYVGTVIYYFFYVNYWLVIFS